jgi:hypothetical protein
MTAEASTPTIRRPTRSGGPHRLTTIIHDGDGTWFSPSALFVAALTDEELERLLDGEERLPNTLPALNLLEVLPEMCAGDDQILWT